MTRIYFCGSIRGGREQASTYREIIRILSGYGEVLTEHVGSEQEVSEGDAMLNDTQIHDRDLQWIRESDVMVAEVTIPSLGVGYEIGRAIEMGIPVLSLYRTGSQGRLSAMIAGSSGVDLRYYNRVDQLKTIISGFMAQHAPRHTSGSS
jgi:hypothetical protein